MLFDQNVVTWQHFDIFLSFHGNRLFYNIWNTFEMKDSFSPASGFWNFNATFLDQKLCAIDPIHAAKSWNKASFSWIERHTEGDGTMMLRHRNVK